MQNQNFTATLLVDQTPEEALAAINNIRGWWSEDIEGNTDKLGHEFMYRDKHLRAKMKITELIPGKKVVWHVLESQMDDIEEVTEWDDTKLIFEIRKKDDSPIVIGPKFSSPIWDWYLNLIVIPSVQKRGIFILSVVYRD
jgi:hypothetical protein